MDDLYNERFYSSLLVYAKERYNLTLPEKPLPLEKDPNKAVTQLERAVSVEGVKGAFCIGLVHKNADEHDFITNTCGRLSIPSKCISTEVTEEICAGKLQSLKYVCSSIISRAGGVPWILHDKLNHDCYVAVDVGRSRAEWWAMSVVYDRDGKYTVRQGNLMVGEDLDEQSIRMCVMAASEFAPNSESLILLRHGDIHEGERRAFTESSAKLDYAETAIVSIKENVPYRIFRRLNSYISKPISGDYYPLDRLNVVLCGAGGEEYEHGTPQPMVAEIIHVKGEVDTAKVIEDLFRLTFLNWGSPGRSYSLPAPIHLAHKFAYELSAGIQRFGPPF